MGQSRFAPLDYLPRSDIKLDPRPVEEVQVFFKEKPAEPYTELGIFVWRFGPSSNPERTFNRYRERAFELFRKSAAEIGADAIIISDPKQVMEPGAVYNEVTIPGRKITEVRGVAVIYKQTATHPPLIGSVLKC